MEADTKPIFKKWWFWVGAIVILGFIVKVVTPQATQEKWAKEDADKQAQAKKSAAISVTYGDSVNVDESTHTATFYAMISSYYDESSFEGDHLSKAINYARKAFGGDSTLQHVELYTRMKSTDTKGNIDTLMLASVKFDRAKFMAIHWENLNGKLIIPSIAQALSSKEDIWVRASIDEKANPEMVEYNEYK